VSELVGRLADGHPFAASWFQRTDGKFVYSLRVRDGDFDVSEFAKQFGGGGHAKAAGFTVDRLVHEVLP
jgi:nanoRNase/pAp phosphatase (c-di-AMP/oligoRNAs hydrolase)